MKRKDDKNIITILAFNCRLLSYYFSTYHVHILMKNILLLSFMLFGNLILAQNKQSVELVWAGNNTYSFGSYSVQIPHFTAKYFQYNESEKSIVGVISIPQTFSAEANSLIISDVIYESISSIGDLNPSLIPTKLISNINSSRARVFYYNYYQPYYKGRK